MHERKWPTFNAISEKPFSNPQATQLVEKGKKRARPDIRVEATTASSHPLLADWRCTFPVAAKRRCDDHHECNSNTGWKEHQNYFHYGQKWGSKLKVHIYFTYYKKSTMKLVTKLRHGQCFFRWDQCFCRWDVHIVVWWFGDVWSRPLQLLDVQRPMLLTIRSGPVQDEPRQLKWPRPLKATKKSKIMKSGKKLRTAKCSYNFSCLHLELCVF